MIFKESVYFLYDAEKCVLLSPAKEFFTAQNEFAKKRKTRSEKTLRLKIFRNSQFLKQLCFLTFLFATTTKNDNPSNGFTRFLSLCLQNHDFLENHVFL